MGKLQIKRGMVVFLPFAAGSKSDSLRPYLYVNCHEKFILFKQGDNPFENSSLTEYDGCRAEICGYFNNDTFVVVSVKVDANTKNSVQQNVQQMEGENND